MTKFTGVFGILIFEEFTWILSIFSVILIIKFLAILLISEFVRNKLGAYLATYFNKI